MNASGFGIKCICISSCFLTGTLACGLIPATPTNPFGNIATANVFRLRQPPEPERIKIPDPPLPQVILTGIFDGFDKVRVLLEVTPPNQPKIFLTLYPGQQEGKIEVLKADVKAGTVEAKVSGIVTHLVLNRNTPQPAVAATSRPPAGVAPTPVPLSPAPPQLNRDQSALIIEAERERLRQAGDPMANLMPITHLTPAGAPGTEASEFQPSSADADGPLRKRVPQS